MTPDQYKILAIIPARGGSKRVPGKNFRPFGGTTLVDLAVSHAIGSKWLTDIVLSSDHQEVLAIGSKYPAIKCLPRPADISTDEAPAIDYVRHVLSVMEKENARRYDIVVILQPSSPLRQSSDVDATVALLCSRPEVTSAVSIVKLSHMVHPLKLKVLEGETLKPFLEDEKGRFAAGELPDIYVRNCAVYVTWRKDLETRRDVIGDVSVGYMMPPERSIDINDPVDFDFAQYLFLKNEQV